MRNHSFILLSFLILLHACGSDNEVEEKAENVSHLVWHWEDEFNAAQKAVLKEWMAYTWVNSQQTLGNYPFDVHIFFNHSFSNRAVSFGLATKKNNRNEAHFYVDPNAGISELKEDWIAPHEISHLSIPFLGKSEKWFTEGFATFLSRQIMMDAGLLTAQELEAFYQSKIANSKKYYNSSTKTFPEISDSLMKNHLYGSMYWGSASYFLTMDNKLKAEKSMRFVDVLKEYQKCCRTEDRGILQVVQSFDNIIEETWFTALLNDYRERKAFELMKPY